MVSTRSFTLNPFVASDSTVDRRILAPQVGPVACRPSVLAGNRVQHCGMLAQSRYDK